MELHKKVAFVHQKINELGYSHLVIETYRDGNSSPNEIGLYDNYTVVHLRHPHSKEHVYLFFDFRIESCNVALSTINNEKALVQFEPKTNTLISIVYGKKKDYDDDYHLLDILFQKYEKGALKKSRSGLIDEHKKTPIGLLFDSTPVSISYQSENKQYIITAGSNGFIFKITSKGYVLLGHLELKGIQIIRTYFYKRCIFWVTEGSGKLSIVHSTKLRPRVLWRQSLGNYCSIGVIYSRIQDINIQFERNKFFIFGKMISDIPCEIAIAGKIPKFENHL
ncbi:MAG: hypothetical protein WCO58_02095 [bacterium]